MPILDPNIVLSGQNNQKSNQIFDNRLNYDKNVIISDSINTWQNKNLFGRIDHKMNPIFLNEVNLKAVTSNMFAIDFVADAFHDLATYYNQLKLSENYHKIR